MMLREYQQRALSMLYDWMSSNDGNPCVVMPTGSGKSVVIAELCRQALQEWPETRIVMLTRSMELIQQNAEKLRTIWPGAPMGVYSASLGKKQLGEPITIGGPLSLARIASKLGHTDMLVVDESHDISHKDEGTYRKIIDTLLLANHAMRVVGFSATPYRLGHGLITDKPAIFDGLIEPVSIEELVFKGFLSTLRSRATRAKLDTSGVHKRGGEFIEAELQAAVDTAEQNDRVVRETIALAGDRRSWLFFCSGVAHAEHIRNALIANGICAACVTGETPKSERERILEAYKAGEIRALTNANVLTTGFDAPATDLIAMLRPTMSPGLYVQMAGRGMRIADGKTDCLVLDFAGNVERHGPITAVRAPTRSESRDGDPPSKQCPDCNEIVAIAARQCPACGHQFAPPEPKPLVLRDDDIMGLDGSELTVRSWKWRPHVSKASGKLMLAVTYYGDLSDRPVTEYLPILHDGYAGDKAVKTLVQIATQAGAFVGDLLGLDGTQETLNGIGARMNFARPPATIEYRMDGKFHRVIERRWTRETAAA